MHRCREESHEDHFLWAEGRFPTDTALQFRGDALVTQENDKSKRWLLFNVSYSPFTGWYVSARETDALEEDLSGRANPEPWISKLQPLGK